MWWMAKLATPFRVWAPNAQNVHLIGDFTNWYGEQIPMTRNEGGVWEVFTDLPKEGDIYKYNIKPLSKYRIYFQSQQKPLAFH